jgi:hypothetical protein
MIRRRMFSWRSRILRNISKLVLKKIVDVNVKVRSYVRVINPTLCTPTSDKYTNADSIISKCKRH